MERQKKTWGYFFVSPAFSKFFPFFGGWFFCFDILGMLNFRKGRWFQKKTMMINQYMEAAPSPLQVVFPNLESLHHPPLNANGSTTKKASGWLLLPYATRTMFSQMLRVKVAFNFHENPFLPVKPWSKVSTKQVSSLSSKWFPLFPWTVIWFSCNQVNICLPNIVFCKNKGHYVHISPQIHHSDTKKKLAFRRDQNQHDFSSIPQVQMGHRCSSRLGC